MLHLSFRRWLLVLAATFLFSSAAMADVNVNTASESELESLPGIGPAKAAAIMKYRDDNGPFSTVEQLDNVPGIGPATMANLRPLISVGDGLASASSADVRSPATQVSADDRTPRVNINTASAGQLEELPGIGATKAAAIVSYRDRTGPFASCDALDAVEGIGPATVAAVQTRCTAE